MVEEVHSYGVRSVCSSILRSTEIVLSARVKIKTDTFRLHLRMLTATRLVRSDQLTRMATVRKFASPHAYDVVHRENTEQILPLFDR